MSTAEVVSSTLSTLFTTGIPTTTTPGTGETTTESEVTESTQSMIQIDSISFPHE